MSEKKSPATRRIALFKNIEFGFSAPHCSSAENSEDYIRVSEYVDVEFPLLAREDIVTKQVNALKQAKKSVQAEAQIKVTTIDRQISELLALPQIEE